MSKGKDDGGQEPPDTVNHFAHFNNAMKKALVDFGRPPGDYEVNVTFTAKVKAENPGHVVEWIVTLA